MTAIKLLTDDRMTLSAMTERDIPAIRELHARSFAMLARDWHTPEQIVAHVGLINRTDYADDLRRSHITIARVTHEIVATSGWLAVTGQSETARIRKVFVHPAMARRGLGSMMVNHAEDAARNAGYKRLIVRANINAVGLYAKLDYAPLHRDLMMGANGVELPVLMMQKHA